MRMRITTDAASHRNLTLARIGAEDRIARQSISTRTIMARAMLWFPQCPLPTRVVLF